MISSILNKYSDGQDLAELIGKPVLLSFLNPYSYLVVRDRKDIVESVDKWAFDGKLLQFFFSFFLRGKYKRASFDFTSLADPFFKAVCKKNKTLYVVGTAPELVSVFAEIIATSYPGIKLIGVRDGYFSDDEEYRRALKKIVMVNPDTVLCGMGALKQERFIIDLRELGWLGFGVTCGGFMHQTASAGGRYYPPIFDKLNLRFLYRIIDEPKLFWRYLTKYPQFVLVFFKDWLLYLLKHN